MSDSEDEGNSSGGSDNEDKQLTKKEKKEKKKKDKKKKKEEKKEKKKKEKKSKHHHHPPPSSQQPQLLLTDGNSEEDEEEPEDLFLEASGQASDSGTGSDLNEKVASKKKGKGDSATDLVPYDGGSDSAPGSDANEKKKHKKKKKGKEKKLLKDKAEGEDAGGDEEAGAAAAGEESADIVPYDGGSESGSASEPTSTELVKKKKGKDKKKDKDKKPSTSSELVPFEKKDDDEAQPPAPAPPPPPPAPTKLPFIAWSNKPAKVKEMGLKLLMKVPEKTDLWRKTRHDFIMDNAPFYWHKVSGDFEVVVKVTADVGVMYDRAGIQIRENEENWMTSGIEIFNDEVNHANCVTKDYSDWSLASLPDDCHKNGVWICVKRLGLSYECFYSLDGKKWVQTRQGMISESESVRVGIFGACPQGESFRATFENYRLKQVNK